MIMIARSMVAGIGGVGTKGRGKLFVGIVEPRVQGLPGHRLNPRGEGERTPRLGSVAQNSGNIHPGRQAGPGWWWRRYAGGRRLSGRPVVTAKSTSIQQQEEEDKVGTRKASKEVAFRRDQRKWWQDPAFPQGQLSAEEVWSGAGAEKGKPRVSTAPRVPYPLRKVHHHSFRWSGKGTSQVQRPVRPHRSPLPRPRCPSSRTTSWPSPL